LRERQPIDIEREYKSIIESLILLSRNLEVIELCGKKVSASQWDILSSLFDLAIKRNVDEMEKKIELLKFW